MTLQALSPPSCLHIINSLPIGLDRRTYKGINRDLFFLFSDVFAYQKFDFIPMIFLEGYKAVFELP